MEAIKNYNNNDYCTSSKLRHRFSQLNSSSLNSKSTFDSILKNIDIGMRPNVMKVPKRFQILPVLAHANKWIFSIKSKDGYTFWSVPSWYLDSIYVTWHSYVFLKKYFYVNCSDELFELVIRLNECYYFGILVPPIYCRKS